MFQIKSALTTVLAASVGLASFVAACTGAAPAANTGNQNAATTDQLRTISVSGNGLAYGKPDLATVSIGIQSRSENPREAMTENNADMAALTDMLKGMGIEEKDIQTSNFSVYAQQEYDNMGNPTGRITYHVDNTVNVTVRDINKLGDVLAQSVESGANSIYGVSFSVADQAALEADARAKAMADARSRADQLAQAAGVSVETVFSISESYYGGGPIFYGREAYGGAAADAAAAPVPVSGGQIQVSIQVNVVYTLK